jgi:hypothetical protein
MDTLKGLPDKLRARHHSWPGALSGAEEFVGVVTIDPVLAYDTWERLSVSTWEIEVMSYPALFHKALVSTLRRACHAA